MRIELLAFAGCPNVDETERRVQEVLNDEHCAADLVRVQVSTPEEALTLRFLGSPSVRVNGEDVEPLANDRHAFGFMCRTYSNGMAVAGTPPMAMLRSAIRRHVGRSM